MKRNLIKNIFSAIAEMIEAGQIIFSRESLSKKLYQLEMKDCEEKYLNQSLRRFQNNGIMKPIRENGRDYYRLTQEGRKKLASFCLKNKFNSIVQKWDGLWRLVIFDIPEDKKSVREGLRSKLREFNFFPIQKSVYVFPFECVEEIDELADFYDLHEDLEVLLVKSLGHKEKQARTFFQSLYGVINF